MVCSQKPYIGHVSRACAVIDRCASHEYRKPRTAADDSGPGTLFFCCYCLFFFRGGPWGPRAVPRDMTDGVRTHMFLSVYYMCFSLIPPCTPRLSGQRVAVVRPLAAARRWLPSVVFEY